MKRRKPNEKHRTIARLYATGSYKTETLANIYKLSVRQIQRIAAKEGVVRTIAESNKLMAPTKHYRKIPSEFRVVRKQITNKTRYIVISNHPYCATCGMNPEQGVRLEVDHIDNDPTNNELSNLQVLCALCNTGKAHVDRFGPVIA